MSDAPLPFLSDSEIDSLCDGLQLPGAQCRYLASLGLLVNRKPNGRPLVARSEFERVLGASRFGSAQNDASAGPNVVALMEHLAKRKLNGKTAQRR
jgi:hypothetical protein